MSAHLSIDRDRLADLERQLGDLRAPAGSAPVMRGIAELVDADHVACWSYEASHDAIAIAELALSGPNVPKRFFTELDRGLRGKTLGLLYSPPSPERAQRNHPVGMDSCRDALALPDAELRRLGLSRAEYQTLHPKLEATVALADRFGIADHASQRIAICDGSHVLAHVVALSDRPFSPRQRQLFRSASELVRRRRLLEHRMSTTAVAHRGFEVALDLLGRAAFVVGPGGRVVHANQLGQALLDRDRTIAAQLREAAADPARSKLEVMLLGEPGSRPFHLVLHPATEVAHVAITLASTYSLGERASQVLSLAATGETTKAIASKLGVAVNTVDYHLTRLYRMFGVRSRAELQRELMHRLIGITRTSTTPRPR